ncbi:hypothetical protein ACP4OV_025253 [Aristida adscensionis]
MISTGLAVNSPARALRRRRRLAEAPSGAGMAAFLPTAERGRRGQCAVHAAAPNPIGCLEAAEPWSGGGAAPAPALALALPGLQMAAPAPGDDAHAIAVPSEERVLEVVTRQAALAAAAPRTARPEPAAGGGGLEAAFDRCGEVCKEYAKTFYLVWCRRTDELVDGPNASHISALALDHWESRLEDVFAGRPYDMLDAALSDTVARFPIDIQPFRDMIEGMRMDITKSRYRSFDELYLYCYYVAGTVGLMTMPVMGILPESTAKIETIYKGALALGVANQLTNILRDVGEDARRGRIYLPMDELEMAGLSENDIFSSSVTDKWRRFMRGQIKRARSFFRQAEEGATELNQESRWPVWASLLLYRQILDEIEANDYNNFTKRAYVPKAKKLMALPKAYFRSLMLPSSQTETQRHGHNSNLI